MAERICKSALEEPDQNAAIRFLRVALPEAESKIPGLRNEGLFATHVLREDAPRRTDWADAVRRAGPLASRRGQELVRGLGFSVRPTDGGRVHLLLGGERRTALAVFLDRTEMHEASSNRFGGASPVSYALAKADEEGLPYVVATSGPTVRVYPVRPGVGIGSRGRSETFVEVHLGVLAPENLGYLWLVLSAPALAPGGTFESLLEHSGRFAVELGKRLRERIYDDVIGDLAEAIADARGLRRHSSEELERTYRATLTLLFRVLFIAYAEDTHALDPALKEHLQRVGEIRDPAKAAERLFDFRVADIAMGSAHFLVAAVDHIERGMSQFLAQHPLKGVSNELARLRSKAAEALQDPVAVSEIEDTQLLRRQIARRCIFGVDMNRMAVDLARLSVWVHTFVPGLPLSFLDRNLRTGNSLVGIATIEEARALGRDLEEEGLEAVDSLFKEDYFQKHLDRARDAVAAAGRSADADAREIEQARKASAKAKAALQPLDGLMTILAASRLDEDLAERLAKGALLNLADAPEQIEGSAALKTASRTLAGTRSFHFPIEFPEVFTSDRPGFDVIVGNPPWEEATFEEDRFWMRFVPGFQGYEQVEQERIKRKWRAERPDLVRQLEVEQAQADAMRRTLLTGPYPGMGQGDPDLYKAFCWRFWALVRPDGGKLGVVLPRSALAAKGSTEFRRKIFETGTFLDLTFLLNNQQWIFPEVHPQYTIALASLERRTPGPDATLPMRGPYASEAAYRDGVSKPSPRYPVTGVLSWTDTASLPLLPSDASADVFLQLRKAPRFDRNEGGLWAFRPYRELDATNDRPHMKFADERPKGHVPVFKGESFDIWQPDTGTYYAYADPHKIVRVLQEKRENSARRPESPWSHLSKADMVSEGTLPYYTHRIAFRDVTRATDSRTVRAALLPPEVAITNKGPYLIRSRGDQKDEAYVLGMLCSIPLDWFARRFVEVNLNYFIFNMLPVPRPARDSALWKRTVKVAGRLAAPDDRFASWAKAVGVECGPLGRKKKDDLVAELDALAARLYGLTEPQLVHIFETFHEGGGPVDRLPQVLDHFRASEVAR